MSVRWVHAFDPTPRAIAHVGAVAGHNPNYLFQPIGLWNLDTTLSFFAPQNSEHVSHSALNLQNTTAKFDAPVRRLSNIMRDLGHGRIDLLKLDIEGAEYGVLETIFEDNLDIGVLCVEFDEYFHPQDAQYRQRIDDWIAKILAHKFKLIHTSGNANYTFAKNRRM